ncbi:MAG: hypothetical protein FJ308_13430 [Planctomycetes bacterium]|nr:hypothetical protein [Planctomycetota bacterium]
MSKGQGLTAKPESDVGLGSESPLITANTVLKIGGSTLFQGPIHALCRSVHTASNERNYIIVGGGETVESMRLLHSVYPQLSEHEMHWRCVDLLDATWQVACELMPKCKPLESWPAIQASLNAPGGQSFLVRVRGFYDRGIEHDQSIEANWIPTVGWQTTTDALAWLLAKRIRAQRLRIAKQCPCDTIRTIHDASTQGIVDADISRLVARDPEAASLCIELFSLEETLS